MNQHKGLLPQHTALTTKVIVKVNKQLESYANDPFFVKKNEQAAAFLQAHGLPKALRKRRK